MQIADLKGSRLSSQQARLWSLQRQGHTYTALCAFLLKGELHKDALDAALLGVINQHEILRTSFYFIPGMDVPMQVVNKCLLWSCTTIDVADVDTPFQYNELDEFMSSLQEEKWNLEESPLLHTWLLRLSLDTHILLLAMPALCADSYTLKLFARALERTYSAHRQGQSLDEDPLQYADVAAWQDELLLERDAELERQYWAGIDLSLLATMRLPFEREGDAASWSLTKRSATTFAPQVLDIPLDDAFAVQLQALAQQYAISISTWLLACWSAVFWRLCNEERFIIGLSCNGRVFEELEEALGLYTRVLPVEALFERDESFIQFLSTIHTSVEETIKRQMYFSWDSLSTTNENVVFPVCFEYDSWPATHALEAMTASLYRFSTATEPFALKLSALLQGERLQLRLYYDQTRVQHQHAARIISVFSILLQNTIAHPEQPVGMLPVLPLIEQERLLHTFCSPQTPVPQQWLPQLFEEQVMRIPDNPALLSSQDQLTYYELNCRANRLARVLRKFGVGPNILVGLYIHRSTDMIVCLLAVLKAGGAYVPLDPEYPVARLAYQLRDLQIPLVLTQQALLTQLPDWEGRALCIDTMAENIQREATTNLPVVNDPLDLAYVIYTSGSTGRPKGVLIQQRSVVNYTLSLCNLIATESGLHFALTTTLAADLGNTAIFCALASGGCVQVLDYETITSAEAFARWAEQHPIDVLKIVPSHLSALLAGKNARAILPRRTLILGGEAFPGKLLAQLRELGAGCRILNHYGPTEATIGVLVNALETAADEESSGQEVDAEVVPVPLGRPIANAEAYILDRRLQIVPVGVTGELYISGTGLAAGYWHLPEQTAERFIAHPFAKQPGARIYRTGDLARYTSQGLIEFVGRRDNQVKIRGYRIEPGEIEAIIGQYTNVHDVVVVARKDMLEEQRLVCYVVPHHQPAPTAEQLRTYIREHVPEYMVPAAYVLLDAIPLTLNGKVDRDQLPEPGYHERDTLSVNKEPRSPIEEILCDIWKSLLGVPAVGVHDNFFQLGGHSLLATQVISQVRIMLSVELSVLSLFEAPTIAQFAQRIAQALSSEQGIDEVLPLVPMERTQDLPLSFAQQRLWFLDQLEADSLAYLTPRAFRLSGTLDVSALDRSLAGLVERHENLRTTFHEHEGQPVQIIHGREIFSLPFIDLRELPVEERGNVAQRLAGDEARRPCDLSNGPLFRAFLLLIDVEEHVLLMTMHHIITDGWSNNVWVRELSSLYYAFVHGHSSPLPPLSIQYADFALWQRRWLQSQALENQMRYWTNQLGTTVPLDLPTDHPRPAVQSSNGAYQDTVLPLELYEQLQLFSQREGVTLFMTLLAAFQVLLARYSGQEDIAVGTPIANRTHKELEGLIGFFVNTLVLRTDLSGNPSFREIIMRVRQVALNAYACQDVPFEKIVEALQPERDLSRTPLFQVMFILQNGPQAVDGLEGITLRPLPSENKTATFDLTLFVEKDAQGLACHLEYNTDLFEHTSMTRLLGHWRTLLEAIVASTETSLADLPLLTPAETQALLAPDSAQTVPLSAAPFVHQQIEAQVERTPAAIAVSWGDHWLSYEQLNRRANALAQQLRRRGVRPEVSVGLLLERSPWWVIALLATFKAGGVVLPLDPHLPSDRLREVLRQSPCGVLLSEQGTQSRLTDVLAGMPSTQPAWEHLLVEQACRLSAAVEGNEPTTYEPGHLAYILYTSGSTGVPKGVMVEQQGMYNHMQAKIADVELSAADCVAQNGPASFDIVMWQSLAALMRGGRVHVISPEQALQPAGLCQEVERAGVTLLQVVPAMLRALLAELQQQERQQVAAVRWVIPTGDALPAELAERWLARYPEIPLLNTYGATECSDDQCHYAITAQTRGWQEAAIAPLGTPIANMRGYVLDRAGHLVPIGVVGELYLGGVGVGRGYVGQAGVTAETFVPDGYSGQAGARLYRTRDQVRYREDGTLEFLGRTDQLVKIAGYRIEPGEIEKALCEQPAVREAVVVAREAQVGEKALVAYIVSEENASRPLAPQLSDGSEREYVEQWQAVYNGVYAQEAMASQDPTVNRRVWTSSYTNQPLPDEEIAECIEDTVARILLLNPGRVLEIGCGTGQLLFRVAPHCIRYDGTDISGEALRVVKRQCQSRQNIPEMRLMERAADDLSGYESGSYDLVILNEVVQYFPNIAYLMRVIEEAMRVLSPQGHIFIGGVRCLQLLEAFHASVQLSLASDTLPIAQLQQRVRRKMLQDKELVIDPALFFALRQQWPRIGRAQVQLKGGRHFNEFTKFRYDVLLHVGEQDQPVRDARVLDWGEQQMTLSLVQQVLRETEPQVLRVTGVPNARIEIERRARLLLAQNEGIATVGDLKRALHEGPPVLSFLDPEEFWALSDPFPYHVHVSWTKTTADGVFEVIFIRRRPGETAGWWSKAWPIQGEARAEDISWEDYANTPLEVKAREQLTSDLRNALKARIPEYMLPSSFVFLDALPLNSNGKVDRKALSIPEIDDTDRTSSFIAPRTELEEVLAEIFAEVLGIEQVGIYESFFERGGHSLLATQVASRIRKVLPADLSLRVLFESPTVAQLAEALMRDPIKGKDIEKSARILLNVAQLSDEEVEAMFVNQSPGMKE